MPRFGARGGSREGCPWEGGATAVGAGSGELGGASGGGSGELGGASGGGSGEGGTDAVLVEGGTEMMRELRTTTGSVDSGEAASAGWKRAAAST